MSVCQYISTQDGTQSPAMCIRTWQLYSLLEEHGATHLSGILNTQADFLSRHRVQQSEWSLNPQVVRLIFLWWGTPIIDLFASEQNFQIAAFCCWKPSPSALQRDAFNLSVDNLQAYFYLFQEHRENQRC